MLLIRGKNPVEKGWDDLTKIYIIPPEIIEGWENSNGPLQVINPIFFPFPFPACQGGSPASYWVT